MKNLFNLPSFLACLFVSVILLPAGSLAAIDQSPELPEPVIKINDMDGTLQLSITLRVPVQPRDAWAVLTDFEHMPDFIPNLESSRVLQNTGKSMQVEQKGSVSLGMIPIHYESRRQIDLTPHKMIRSHSLSGNTRLDSVMVLTPIGRETLLAYRATAIPDLPVPNSMVSSYMSEMLENQFKAMGQEMIRRSQEPDNKDDNTQIAQQPAAQVVAKPDQKPVQQTTQPAAKKTAVKNKTRPAIKQAQTKKQPG